MQYARLSKRSAANAPVLEAQLEHLEYFRPGKPQPTHRITSLS
jgi:hypothetical protein